MDDNPLGRMFDRKTLEEMLGSETIRDYMRTQETHVPPVAPPVAVEHRPPPSVTSVNFTIRGRADFGTDAYHGPSQDRVKADILNAMTSAPEEGYKYWLPAVTYELTDVWDYTGGNDDQDPHEHRGAPRENTQAEGPGLIRVFLEAIALGQKQTTDRIEKSEKLTRERLAAIERALADERAARALEAAVRQHGGPGGTGPTLHGGSGETVPDGGQRGDGRRSRRGKSDVGGSARSTTATGTGDDAGDADDSLQRGPADPGAVRDDDPAGATPVVAPGYIPVNPHTGEEV